MKYIVAISLIAILLSISVLSACGNIGESSMPTPTPQTTSTPTLPSPTPTPTAVVPTSTPTPTLIPLPTVDPKALTDCVNAKDVSEAKLKELGVRIFTFDELKAFTESDNTNNLPNFGFGDTSTKTRLLIENAQKIGMDAYLVITLHPNNMIGILAGFPTSDQGMVYVYVPEEQDELLKLEVGKKVDELNGLPPEAFDTTVQAILVYGHPVPRSGTTSLDKCLDLQSSLEARLSEVSLKRLTFTQVQNFVSADDTNLLPSFKIKEADDNERVRVLIERAQKAGIEAYPVIVCFSSFYIMLVAFPTIDKGIAFVDAQTDEWLEVKKGEKVYELGESQPYCGLPFRVVEINIFGYLA